MSNLRTNVRNFFSSRRRHTRFDCDWSSDVCSSDLTFPRVPVGTRNVQVLATGFQPKNQSVVVRSEEHTSELQSQSNLVCRLLLEKKKITNNSTTVYSLKCSAMTNILSEQTT